MDSYNIVLRIKMNSPLAWFSYALWVCRLLQQHPTMSLSWSSIDKITAYNVRVIHDK